MSAGDLLSKERFWAIIEELRAGLSGAPVCDEDEARARLHTILSHLSIDELIEFDAERLKCNMDLYRWSLWHAGYLINGGSDDGFYYFREWILLQGRSVFEQALINPDTLASVVALLNLSEEDAESEILYPAADIIYEKRTGEEMPVVDLKWPTLQQQDRWDFESDKEALARLPALSEVLGIVVEHE